MWRSCHVFLLGGVLTLSLSGCATNPATGQRQLSLIGETQEIALGRETAEGVAEEMGLYPDDDLQEYVQGLGFELAQTSERPHLPWQFRVVDDPTVNAFALPGGFIYVTRGILAHLNSEAELMGVLGHEIGHVTARHSVNQLSKAQLASIGLGIGMAMSPELRRYGLLAEAGLSLLFLKFSRDDERQADDLGFRYTTRTGYSPEAMAEVFSVLSQVGQRDSDGRLPSWLATHPDPENRRQRVLDRLADVPQDLLAADWKQANYLKQINGISYGPNPREGVVRNSRFYHPDLEFQFRIPDQWAVQNQKQAVYALSPEEDAILILSLVKQDSPELAARQFFSQAGMQEGSEWARIGRFPSVSRTFSATEGEDVFSGGVAFVEFRGQVYQLLGYSREANWPRYRDALTRAAQSFSRLEDPALLQIEPLRLEVVQLPRAMTLEEFARAYPSAVSLSDLAVLNHTEPGEVLPAGTRVKRVVGTPP